MMVFIIPKTMMLTSLLICLLSDSSFSGGKGILLVTADKHIHLPKITSAVTNIIYQLKTGKHRPTCVKVAKVAKSCQDIYTENNLSPSGEYVIYPLRNAVRVYCSFEGDYGYTFISRKSSGVAFDIEKLYSTNTFAKVRLVTSKGEQREVKVENLLAFKGQSLTFQLNGHQHYQGPQLRNSKLHPYLFLGFLPIKLVQKRSRQGYRAAGKDFTFKNCDANPNSYISFFFDPKHGTLGRPGSKDTFMHGWISSSTVMDYPKYMDDSFYMDWEMHMGGCGGFMTSKILNIKTALGLPFAIPSE